MNCYNYLTTDKLTYEYFRTGIDLINLPHTIYGLLICYDKSEFKTELSEIVEKLINLTLINIHIADTIYELFPYISKTKFLDEVFYKMIITSPRDTESQRRFFTDKLYQTSKQLADIINNPEYEHYIKKKT